MKTQTPFLPKTATILLLTFASFFSGEETRADIAVSGDFDPADESFWTSGGNSGTDGRIGFGGAGTLTINDGSVLEINNTSLGYGEGDSGTATITNGAWHISGGLNVGYSGTGSLSVDGGYVSSTVTVIGYWSTGNGSISVTNSGTWINNGFLSVGVEGGSGSLAISGGYVSTAATNIGSYQPSASGSVTVTDGGTWVVSEALYIGHSGTGSLLISGGGRVSNTEGTIGTTSTAVGEVTVTGQGSVWRNDGSLNIGFGGSDNTLTIEDGGLVTVEDGYWGTLNLSLDGGTDNFLRLDSGYIALLGDETAHISDLIGDGYIQLWNDDLSEWVTVTNTAAFDFVYFETNEAAEAFSGYANLGGYTILTGQAVPEPGTFVLVGLGLGAFLLLRRRR